MRRRIVRLVQKTLPPRNTKGTSKMVPTAKRTERTKIASTGGTTKATQKPVKTAVLSTTTPPPPATEAEPSQDPPPATEAEPSQSTHDGKGDTRDDDVREDNSRRHVVRPIRRREDGSHTLLFVGIIGAIAALLMIVCFAITTVLIVHYRKKKAHAQKGPQLAKKPRKMEAAELAATKFTHAGALVLDPTLKGPVKHALTSQEPTEVTLPTIQFDPKLNEIVDIGSDIEVLKEDKLDSAEDDRGGARTRGKSVKGKGKQPNQRKLKSQKPQLSTPVRARKTIPKKKKP